MKKFVSILLTLMLLTASVACLADGTRSEYNYEKKDPSEHTVYETIWDGSETSGSGVVDEKTYTESHDFDDDGVCKICGYKKTSGSDSGDDTAAAAGTEEEGTDTFTTHAGVELTKGDAAAQVLKKVFASIPAGTVVTLEGVSDEIAAQLMDAINGSAAPAELLAILANFPVQTVDGVECHVVTISYTDANGDPVTEHFAFSTADGSLVSVY